MFLLIAGVESAARRAGYPANIADNLSEQQVVDCDSNDGGCRGGDLPTAFDYLIEAGGYNSGTDYPYTARDGKCKFNKTGIVVPVKGFEWVIDTCQYTDCEKTPYKVALDNMYKKNTAASVCVYVTDEWFDYKSGVFEESCGSDYYILNHCVLMTAYNAEEETVTIRNSWGTAWGDAGYMALSISKAGKFVNRCGVFDEMTFAIVK